MNVEIKIPSPGESINTVELTKWLVNDSEIIEKNQDIAEIDSEKATLTISASDSGKLNILIKEGISLSVGTVIGTIDTSFANLNISAKSTTIADSENEIKEKTQPPATKIIDNYISISPQALKILDENKVDINKIIKSNSKRITKIDVINAISASTTNYKENNQKQNDSNRTIETIKMSSLRRKLAERLVAVKNQTAMLTSFNEVDMSAIISIREKYKEQYLKKHGVKLSLMSFFTRAVCLALQKYPICNASIDEENIVFYKYMDICIAVSTSKGLMAPVIRNVENLSIPEIDKIIEELASKARNNKISIDEMTGGTFTITNGGVFGSMLSTPIINPPQSGILGMHNIIERPIAINGKVEIRPMMYLALSYDHRIIDGKDSVGFLLTIKNIIENPISMLFNGNSPETKLLDI